MVIKKSKEEILENKKKLYEKIKKEIREREKKIERYQNYFKKEETPTSILIKKFKKHKLAVIFFYVLIVMYIGMFLSGFFAPYGGQYKFKRKSMHPPTGIHFFDETGKFIGPYVFEFKQINPIFKKYRKVLDKVITVNGKKIKIYKKVKIRFFVKGYKYKLFFLIPARIHLFGPEWDKNGETPSGAIFLIGADKLGRDLFSRVLHGSWVSLTVGFLGVAISLVIAMVIGGIAGFFGGGIDWILMRIVEIFLLFPFFYFLLFLRTLMPANLSPAQTYIMIVVILALLSWAGLARVIRGFILAVKNEDFVLAAVSQGINRNRILFKHIFPQLSSYLIVRVSLTIPGYILGETGLSFIGLGITDPSISWGLLLKDASQPYMIAFYPWILIPAIPIILAVMSFNMIGDGLRDAFDPRTKI